MFRYQFKSIVNNTACVIKNIKPKVFTLQFQSFSVNADVNGDEHGLGHFKVTPTKHPLKIKKPQTKEEEIQLEISLADHTGKSFYSEFFVELTCSIYTFRKTTEPYLV